MRIWGAGNTLISLNINGCDWLMMIQVANCGPLAGATVSTAKGLGKAPGKKRLLRGKKGRHHLADARTVRNFFD
jgi:hypothetical protein